MAPEVLAGTTPYCGKKADVWSLGVTCFQLLTGEYPFLGETKKDIMNKINSADFKVMP
jgi:serine/threonine protein kinase